MFVSTQEMHQNMSIRVAIVEDDDVVRDSLEVLINGASGFHCVGAHPTSEHAIESAPAAAPQVILMDIQLPQMSGIECVRRLKEILPTAQIIMLTMYDDDQLVFDSLKAGASGYLLKRTPHVEILAAIEDVHSGGSPMTSSIARKVVQMARQSRSVMAPAQNGNFNGNAAQSPQDQLAHLSPREKEILRHLTHGYRYKEIAERLGINIETVRTHLRRIYEKLHVSSRTEAAVKFLSE
jgi:DNA-binding NarL/FixJ family response regulator